MKLSKTDVRMLNRMLRTKGPIAVLEHIGYWVMPDSKAVESARKSGAWFRVKGLLTRAFNGNAY